VFPSLAELRAQPDDPGLRLVYADWLASQGHPRGELIAVQELERRCTSVDELARVRARAHALIRDHEALRPELGLPADAHRRLWAQWDRGFVRRVELHIDRPGPRVGEGLGAWSALLRRLLAHPSLALIEALAISVDIRGEPIDETEASLAIVAEGLLGWLAEPGPKPPMSVTLSTARVPHAGLRERLGAAVSPIRPLWLSLDRTMFPPPAVAPIVALQRALTHEAELRGRYELLWFDARGHRVHCAVVGHELGLFEISDPRVWASDAGLETSGLAEPDPLLQRRALGLLERMAPHFDRAPSSMGDADREAADRHSPLLPAAIDVSALVELGLDEVIARLGSDWGGDLRPIFAALAGFGGYAWIYVERGQAHDQARGQAHGWARLIGLGEDQALVLAQRDE
jgi:uncharacterized protein (TIGR02996 family)